MRKDTSLFDSLTGAKMIVGYLTDVEKAVEKRGHKPDGEKVERLRVLLFEALQVARGLSVEVVQREDYSAESLKNLID